MSVVRKIIRRPHTFKIIIISVQNFYLPPLSHTSHYKVASSHHYSPQPELETDITRPLPLDVNSLFADYFSNIRSTESQSNILLSEAQQVLEHAHQSIEQLTQLQYRADRSRTDHSSQDRTEDSSRDRTEDSSRDRTEDSSPG